jgi:hypothetical protein
MGAYANHHTNNSQSDFFQLAQTIVGASLLANALYKSPLMFIDTTLSRAGSLPQWFVQAEKNPIDCYSYDD